MSIEENKAIVGRWFTEFWGKDYNPAAASRLSSACLAAGPPM